MKTTEMVREGNRIMHIHEETIIVDGDPFYFAGQVSKFGNSSMKNQEYIGHIFLISVIGDLNKRWKYESYKMKAAMEIAENMIAEKETTLKQMYIPSLGKMLYHFLSIFYGHKKSDDPDIIKVENEFEFGWIHSSYAQTIICWDLWGKKYDNYNDYRTSHFEIPSGPYDTIGQNWVAHLKNKCRNTLIVGVNLHQLFIDISAKAHVVLKKDVAASPFYF